PRAVLDLPPRGCINVHASLLPRHRGAAPIAWSILAGDAVTGVTIMAMTEEMDAGDILLQRETPIAPDDTGGALGERLARLGAGSRPARGRSACSRSSSRGDAGSPSRSSWPGAGSPRAHASARGSAGGRARRRKPGARARGDDGRFRRRAARRPAGARAA